MKTLAEIVSITLLLLAVAWAPSAAVAVRQTASRGTPTTKAHTPAPTKVYSWVSALGQ